MPSLLIAKLWLAHGITTIREPGSFNGLDWVLAHKERSARNQIAAPRIVPYAGFGMGRDEPIVTAAQARAWVRDIARQGASGIKFFGAAPEVMSAALAEAKEQGLGTMMHHAQLDVARWNVLDSARAGLGSMEHWYGLPEAMFEDRVIQDYPPGYNYSDEQHRFGEAGRLWAQAAAPGSPKWNAVRDELVALDFTIDPTFTIYEDVPWLSVDTLTGELGDGENDLVTATFDGILGLLLGLALIPVATHVVGPVVARFSTGKADAQAVKGSG